MKNKKILVIAAHPDDELMGCGGALRTWLKSNKVRTVILGEGAMARTGATNKNKRTVQKQAVAANKKIGVENLQLLQFPDNRFDTVALLDIVKVIELDIARFRPDWILTHHYGDLNIDHQRTFQAVLAATRPMPGKKKIGVVCFETPSATEWNAQCAENVFKPNLYIDITKTIEVKLRALAAYKTEMKKYPHARSIKGIRAMAQNWGRKIGVEYAEAYEIIRTYEI